MTPNEEQRKAERRQLEADAAKLLKNEGFMRIANKLFKLAPPEVVAFSAADGYNPHGAAFRDGARSVTALLQSLMYPKDENEPAKRRKAAKADFTGEPTP
jgi:hypothetical protein